MPEQEQLVGDAVGKDRVEPGIGADDLVLVVGGRVAVIERLDVGFDIGADLGDRLQKRKGHALRFSGDGLRVAALKARRVAQHDGGLLFQVVDDILQQNGDIVAHGIGAVMVVGVVAGINDDLELFQNVDHHVLVGVLKHLVLVDHTSLGVIFHEHIDNAVDFFIHAVCHTITSKHFLFFSLCYLLYIRNAKMSIQFHSFENRQKCKFVGRPNEIFVEITAEIWYDYV